MASGGDSASSSDLSQEHDEPEEQCACTGGSPGAFLRKMVDAQDHGAGAEPCYQYREDEPFADAINVPEFTHDIL